MKNVILSKDITTLSIPFVCGILSGHLLPCGTEAAYIPASAACLACALVLPFIICRRKAGPAIYAALFFIGAAYSLTARLPGLSGHTGLPAASRAMDAFTQAIDAAGFGHESTAALLKALLTGRKESMDPDVVRTFRDGGGAHILALSGLHLGIIYGMLSGLLSILGNSRISGITRSILTVSACGLYALMTGLSPSIVRAFLFISLNECRRHSPGRESSPVRTLCAALVIQLAATPNVIASVGFQLSYLAMLGICCIKPQMDRLYPESEHDGPMRRVWTSASTAISCQATTAPLVLIRFHTFPKYFLICNLTALPLTEALMVCALLTLGLDLAGICPDMMKGLTDNLAQALIFCLRTVSEM